MKVIIVAISLIFAVSAVAYAEEGNKDDIYLNAEQIQPLYPSDLTTKEVLVCPKEAPIRCDINNTCCPTSHPICGWDGDKVMCFSE